MIPVKESNLARLTTIKETRKEIKKHRRNRNRAALFVGVCIVLGGLSFAVCCALQAAKVPDFAIEPSIFESFKGNILPSNAKNQLYEPHINSPVTRLYHWN